MICKIVLYKIQKIRYNKVGSTVTGTLDWAARLDAMQQHTGEHILSGTLHRLYGAENVGFHIGDPYVRMDTSIPLTAQQLAEAEAQANAAVWADTPVRCYLPDPDTLAATEYRSKKELEGPVRLVEAGGDCCACCGTHLARTGEVGLIKILSAQHYKTGMRLTVACGQRAYNAVAAGWADDDSSIDGYSRCRYPGAMCWLSARQPCPRATNSEA